MVYRRGKWRSVFIGDCLIDIYSRGAGRIDE